MFLCLVISILLCHFPVVLCETKWIGTGSEYHTIASLNNPSDVAVDDTGNVYIADHGNQRLVRLDAAGNLLSQSSLSGADNIAVHPTNSQVYVSDRSTNRVYSVRLPNNNQRTGGSVSVFFSSALVPRGVSTDSLGNVFIADSGNGRVVQLNSDGNILRELSFANTSINSPSFLAIDSHDRIYILDDRSNELIKIDVNGTIEFRYPRACPAQWTPSAVAVDSFQDVYVSCVLFNVSYTSQVLKSDKCGNLLNVFTATDVTVSRFAGIGVDALNNLYVTSSNATDHRILKINTSSNAFAVITLDSLFLEPYHVALDKYGALYTTDAGCNCVIKLTRDGKLLARADTNATRVDNPYGIAINEANEVFVSDWENQKIVKLKADLSFEREYHTTGMRFLAGMCIDRFDNIYVTAPAQRRLVKVDKDGSLTSFFTSNPTTLPFDVALDKDGNLYVADSVWIVKLNGTGVVQNIFSTTSPDFSLLFGVAVDRFANIFVSDGGYQRIVVMNQSNNVTQIYKTLYPSFAPTGSIVDEAGDFLYVADSSNARIIVFPTPDHPSIPTSSSTSSMITSLSSASTSTTSSAASSTKSNYEYSSSSVENPETTDFSISLTTVVVVVVVVVGALTVVFVLIVVIICCRNRQIRQTEQAHIELDQCLDASYSKQHSKHDNLTEPLISNP